MITKFKLFESEVKIEANSCWTIFGSRTRCIKILKKLKIQFDLGSNINSLIEIFEGDMIKDSNLAIGTNLFYDPGHFSYHTYEKESDRKKYFENYEYKGEIKEVDDKIVLDD